MAQAIQSVFENPLDAETPKGKLYLRDIWRKVVSQFQAEPLHLSKRDAEDCADKIVRIVRNNHTSPHAVRRHRL